MNHLIYQYRALTLKLLLGRQICLEPSFSKRGKQLYSSGGFSPKDYSEPLIPPYEEKIGEPIHLKRARLVYQSRKRGMLENCLILSCFADKFLKDMSEEELSLYDRLINLPSNDWEIYYWATGVKPTPAEFQNSVMTKLKEFVKNEHKENRTQQPNL